MYPARRIFAPGYHLCVPIACRRPFAVALLLVTGIADAADSGRRALSYDAAAADVAIIRQHELEIGDVPHHLLRVYDLRRVFTRRPAVFAGVAATQMRERGVADLIDQSGTQSAYVTYLLADGSRIFGRYTGTVLSSRWPDGSWHHEIRGRIELTGGSGPFQRLRGSVDVRYALDPGAESSQGESVGEYWFEP
jgi:hypothetical protein